GLEEMNKNIVELNGGVFHQPIRKVRTFESLGNKFSIGSEGNKMDKWVETAKGTNLFFAIYIDENGNRTFNTIPLNIVVERLKQGLREVPEMHGDSKLLFFLSPNDLVYLPNADMQNSENQSTIEQIEVDRIYRFVDSSDTTANFIQASVSSLIFSMTKKEQEKKKQVFHIQDEFGLGSPQSKNQKAISGEMIKTHCFKLSVDRLGKVLKVHS
ncbi:MAG: type II CRISPR RNA-guided endonuclease Cas9, partial [Bacteroidetes bacterium]|nr:type II CRISPR RNA-guided endonuclease Cas9 [Bacteroidota bacterium]